MFVCRNQTGPWRSRDPVTRAHGNRRERLLEPNEAESLYLLTFDVTVMAARRHLAMSIVPTSAALILVLGLIAPFVSALLCFKDGAELTAAVNDYIASGYDPTANSSILFGVRLLRGVCNRESFNGRLTCNSATSSICSIPSKTGVLTTFKTFRLCLRIKRPLTNR